MSSSGKALYCSPVCCVCLVGLPVRLSGCAVTLSVLCLVVYHLSISLSISVRLSVCFCLSVCLSVCLCLSIILSVCLPSCRSVFLSVSLPVCHVDLFVSLSLSLYLESLHGGALLVQVLHHVHRRLFGLEKVPGG
jgi:hypothetical protein